MSAGSLPADRLPLHVQDGSSDDDDDEDELDEEDEELLNLKQQLRAYEQEVKDFEAVVEAATQSYNQANRLLKVSHIVDRGVVQIADYS